MNNAIGGELTFSEGADRLENSKLLKLLENSACCTVLTGAGLSKGSGIPTYRDDKGIWKSTKPIQHGDFMRSHESRQRYWARSFSGWPIINSASPNLAHESLATLEARGRVHCVVTQNVDRLHQKAGHRNVIDLHGRLDQVLCMDCGAKESRVDVQDRLKVLNPQLVEEATIVRPDGDADVAQTIVNDLVVPTCSRCDGLMKPDVVFYGSFVEKKVVDQIISELSQADLLLIVGSSLMVYSSYRFCKFAAEHSIPIACINQGVTRADELFHTKLLGDCGTILSTMSAQLA